MFLPFLLGAVHKVCYAIFANFYPLPLSHFVTHPGTPQKYVTHLGPPRFLVGLVQKPRQRPLYKFSLNCSWGFLSGGFVFCLEGFVLDAFCPFPLLSDCMC